MGRLHNGQWSSEDRLSLTQGSFKREESTFRNWITPDGSPGPSGKGGFRAEPGRYHLYVSYACPWAHRTILFRAFKNLEPHLSMSAVHPHMLQRGWEFLPTHPHFCDPVNYCRCLSEVYLLANPFYTGRVTVPLLWDKQQHTIVSNESAEIIRMLNSAFPALTKDTPDFYPRAHREAIDRFNAFIYEKINNGVYHCGFATTQKDYEVAFDALFAALDELEGRLEAHPFLIADSPLETDWRLFTTLIRFDIVYHTHFKCNLRLLRDYTHLSRYLKTLYHSPKVAQTVSFDQIKRHYYYSHVHLNPSRIVPKGPSLTSLWAP